MPNANLTLLAIHSNSTLHTKDDFQEATPSNIVVHKFTIDDDDDDDETKFRFDKHASP